jgi:FkbM family methyltransferase
MYHIATDTIRLPEYETFSNAAAYYATYLHELVHWTGHQKRCNRPLKNKFGSWSYAFEELIAEIGAAMVCNQLGIDSKLEHHASYLDFWLKILKDDKKAFFDVGANIGWYSFLAADAGVERIVAFEFMNEYANFISENFKKEGIPATVVKKGVGAPNRFEKYSDPLAKTSGALISLDEYAKVNNIWPDIMKMDIEGFELDALRNAHEILLRKPALDISLHDRFLLDRGQSENEVLSLLSSYGYKIVWQGGGTYFMVA